jgi:hypothetical protein
MVKCVSCGKLVKFDGAKCEECGHEYTFEEIKKLAVQEQSAKEDLSLRLMLKDRIYRLDFATTILLLVGIVLAIPAILNINLYLRIYGAANVADYALSVRNSGIVYAVLAGGCLIASLVCHIVKKLSIKKSANLNYYNN